MCKRILVLVQSLGGGGAERVAVDMANGLSDLGNKVTVLTNTDLPIVYNLHENIKVYNNHKYKWTPRVFNRFCILNAIKIIKKNKPDVVVGVMWGEALTARISMLFTNLKVPVVFSDHDCFVRPYRETLRRMFTKRLLSKWCNYYTVLTESDRQLCIEHDIKNVRVMNNPLSLTPTYSTTIKKNTILAVGRLDAWHYKGFDILIKAWGQIAHKHSDWKVEIVGSGTEKSMMFLKNLTVKYNCEESVIFSGHHIDMQSKYRSSAIFVLSSRYEGFGLVLIEAMSQNCACIACDYNGRQRDIITDNVDGIIAETDSVQDLSDKIDLLINDENLRRKLQEQSPTNLMRYSVKEVAKKWDDLLSEIIGINRN